MATKEKDIKGWEIVFDQKVGRRHVGQNRGSGISLRRSIDNLEINEGDCISFYMNSDQEEKVTGLGFIKDIMFGVDKYLVVKILWFIKYNQNLEKYLPSLPNNTSYTDNDLFLTPSMDSIKLDQILYKHNVVGLPQLKKIFDNINSSKENNESIFICRRFTDDSTTYFTDLIDWNTMYDSFKENKDEFYDTLKMLTLKPTLKNKSPTKTTVFKSNTPSPLKNKISKKRSIKKIVSDSEDDLEIVEAPVYIKSTKITNDYESSDESELISDDSLDDFIVQDENDDNDIRYYNSEKRKAQRSPPKRAYKKRSKIMVPELPYIDNDLQILTGEEHSTTKMLIKAKKILGTGTKLKSLPCREDEFYSLYHNLETTITSEKGCCIYVSGTPGVGKTATIREVIKQLSAKMTIESNGIKKFNYLEINGLKLIKPQQSYEILWQKISNTKASTNNSLSFLQQHFENNENKEYNDDDSYSDRLPLVVLLDELDQIVTKNQAVMYNFFNWPTYENSKLIVIAVANTMDLPERLLTNKISSRLGLSRIQFTSYSYTQLSEIIKHRLEQLSQTDDKLLIAKDAIEFASRKVASVSGDARRSLMICIRAVEIAQTEFINKSEDEKKELDGKYTVTIMHIMKAVNEISSSPVSGYLNSLSFLSKLVLASIMLRKKRSGVAEVLVGDVYDELNNQIQVLLFTEMKSKLAEEDLQILDIVFGAGNQRMTGSVINASLFILKDLEENGILMMQQLNIERDRLVRLNISDDEILNSFKKDLLMKEIIAFV
jgi:origin recognition complex subunit 1